MSFWFKYQVSLTPDKWFGETGWIQTSAGSPYMLQMSNSPGLRVPCAVLCVCSCAPPGGFWHCVCWRGHRLPWEDTVKDIHCVCAAHNQQPTTSVNEQFLLWYTMMWGAMVRTDIWNIRKGLYLFEDMQGLFWMNRRRVVLGVILDLLSRSYNIFIGNISTLQGAAQCLFERTRHHWQIFLLPNLYQNKMTVADWWADILCSLLIAGKWTDTFCHFHCTNAVSEVLLLPIGPEHQDLQIPVCINPFFLKKWCTIEPL